MSAPIHFYSLPAERSAAVKPSRRLQRDILWGRPVFKAPELPNPRIIFDPLPFTAVRVTQPGRPADER